MIVRLIGGLGNQMFQYAFGRSVSLLRNTPLSFSRKLFGRRNNHIQYMLDVYDVNLSFSEPEPQKEIYHETTPGEFDRKVYSTSPDSIYSGYWQTEKYFNADVIRKELRCPKMTSGSGGLNAYLTDQICSTDSAFIHVRRGDYLSAGTKEFHGVQSIEYYMAGADRIKQEVFSAQFYVFSDDPEWCKSNFPGDFIIVDHNRWQERTAQWDIWLMSLCKHGVVSNSSFSWWGAWLGDTQPRIVVAPKRWFLADINAPDLVPERWIRL